MDPDRPEQPSTARGLARRAANGLSWTTAGALASNLLRVAVVAVLGRALTPTDFGLVAAAMTMMLLAQTVRDAGVGMALVQRQDLHQAHVDTAFVFSVLLGAGLGLLVFVGAPLMGALYDMPEAVELLRALSLLFVIRGLSSTSLFVLQRDMRFKAMTLIDTAGYVAGSITSVALALTGAGPWALVAGYLVEASSGSALLLWLRPPRLRIRPTRRHLRELLGFGGGHTIAQIANYFATQGDYMVVGRALDAASLGLYTRAYELVRFPALIFSTIVGAVLFPAFSRIQDDRERLARAFRRALFVNAVLLVPASAVLAVLAPEAIELLMGAGWEAAVLPFRIMCMTMLCRTSYKLACLIARSSGDVGRLAMLQVVYAVSVIGGATLSVRWGISGVAVSTALAIVATFLAVSDLALRRTGLGWARFARVHLAGLTCALPVVLAALPAARMLRSGGQPAGLVVAGTTLAGALGFLAVAFVGVRRPDTDAAWSWRTLRAVIRGRREPKDARR